MNPFRITIHCTGTKNGAAVPAKKIREWHLARGFKDIGYHLVIQPDGEVEHGRGLNEEGAHVTGANEGNIGICLPGLDLFTPQQFGTLRELLEALRLNYEIESWEIRCHNQFVSAQKQGKTCPNMEIGRILCWYLTGDERAIAPYLLKQSGGTQ